MTIKSFFVICLSITTTTILMAQRTNVQQGKKDQALINTLPTAHLYGKIVNQDTKKPVPYASVLLILVAGSSQKKDTVLKGTLAEKNGDFNIDNIRIMATNNMLYMQRPSGNIPSLANDTNNGKPQGKIYKMKPAKYKLQINITGYKKYEMPISFASNDSTPPLNIHSLSGAQENNADQATMARNMMTKFDQDLGNISLQPKKDTINVTTLDEVTVTSNKNQAELSIDKRTYHVADMPLAENGTAVDIMKNIPMLSVDINGNVALRNASPTIFMDGQPTDLTLDMIPSEMIEKVEVITNPSAKYDASASKGILNIITKKNDRFGYFGMVRLGIDRFGLPNVNGNVSIRKRKINFNLVLNEAMRKNEMTGQTNRNTPTSILTQKERGTNFRFNMINVRPSIDFYITNRSTLTIGGAYILRNFNHYSNQEILQQNLVNQIPTSLIYQTRNGSSKGIINLPEANISFIHLFPKEGEKLSMSARYSGGKVYRPTLLHQQQWDTSFANGQPISQYYQQTQATSQNQRARIQLDYENPFRKNMEIDAGFAFHFRYTNQQSNIYRSATSQNITNPANEIIDLRNIYNNIEQTYALYGNFKHQIQLPNHNLLSYQVGLRGEVYLYSAQVTDSNNNTISYINNYYKNPLDILYPSVYLSYKMPDIDQEFQFNYSRRVTRPFFMQTNPYLNYVDSLNVRQGNPNLKPAFSNYFEFNYNKNITDIRGNRQNIMASIYLNYTTGMITMYQYSSTIGISNNPLLISSFINAGTSIVSGIELTPQFQLFSWWTLHPSFNLYYSDINTPSQSILNATVSQTHLSQWSYYAKLSMDFSLPKEVTIQLVGDYNSKRISSAGNAQSGGMFNMNLASSQGFIKPIYGVDIAIKKTFTKITNPKLMWLRPLAITLNTSDIFGIRYMRSYTDLGPGLYQSSSFRINPYYVSLNISFRFGKIDTNVQKKRVNQDSRGDDAGNLIGM